MKWILILLVFLSTTSFAQKQKLDSIVVKGVYASDTAQVRYIIYQSDGSLNFKNGYLISKYFYFNNGQQPLDAGKNLFTDKFIAVKEQIFDVKNFTWK
jgi:hypothetical protein